MNFRLASTEALNLLIQLPECKVKTVAVLTVSVSCHTFASDYQAWIVGKLQSIINFVGDFNMPGGLNSVTFQGLASDKARCHR